MSAQQITQHVRRETVLGTVKQAYASDGNTKIGMRLVNSSGDNITGLTIGEWAFLQGQPEGYKVTIVREFFASDPEPATDPGPYIDPGVNHTMNPLHQATIDAAARAIYVSDWPDVPAAGATFDFALQVNPNDKVVVDCRRRAVVAINAYRATQEVSA